MTTNSKTKATDETLVVRHVISFGQTDLGRTTYFFCIGLLRFKASTPATPVLVVAMH